MQAVVLSSRGRVELLDVPKPSIGPGDILLEVKAAGICGGDLHFVDGTMGSLGDYPIILGHEFAGVIAEVGPDVDPYWSVGDRVVSDNTGSACGRCPACQGGDLVNCADRGTLGVSMDGGYTKYVKISGDILRLYPSCLLHIPERLSCEEATVLEPASNAYKAVVQEGGIRPGETLVVFGAGPQGLMAVQMGRIAGAAKIILVGRNSAEDTRFALGRKLGATHTINTDTQDGYEELIHDIAGPNGVAVVVDAAGATSVLNAATRIVRAVGTVVRVGMNDEPYGHGLDDVNVKSATIRGHLGYNAASWRNSIALAEAGMLDLASLITHRLPLSSYREGFAITRSREAIKAILLPED